MYNNGNIMVQFSSIQKEKMIHLNKNIYQKKYFPVGGFDLLIKLSLIWAILLQH